MKNRVTLLGRRGDVRIPWRRTIEFSVGYDWTPGQVLAVVDAALERVDIPFVAADPVPICLCTGFDGNAIKYVVHYWLTELRHYLTTDSRMRVHVYAALGRPGMEIPISRSELFLHSARSPQAQRSEHERESRRGDCCARWSCSLRSPRTKRHALAAQLIADAFRAGRHRDQAGRAVRFAVHPGARPGRHFPRTRSGHASRPAPACAAQGAGVLRRDGPAHRPGAHRHRRRRIGCALLPARQARLRGDHPRPTGARRGDVEDRRRTAGGQRRDARVALRRGAARTRRARARTSSCAASAASSALGAE